MATRVATFPLRLPVSLKVALETISDRDGTSMNQFLVAAAAEKLPRCKPRNSSWNGATVLTGKLFAVFSIALAARRPAPKMDGMETIR